MRMTVRTAPLIGGVGVATILFDGDWSARRLVMATVVALAVGLPLVFAIGVVAQILPRGWYER